MNLVLLLEDDFIDQNSVRLYGRRRDHILAVQRPEIGTALTVGLLNGGIGRGVVTAADSGAVTMQVSLTGPAPAALPATLILALPRPKMIQRILQTATTMGVKRLYLINSRRVEKSYWQSPLLAAAAIREQLLLGLEQAKDTQLPSVELRQRFKPFVEDELPALAAGSRALLAHPGAAQPCPLAVTQAVTLAVGPEGGFIPYEVEKLTDCGFQAIHLGSRILRVETAIPVLLGKLF